MICYRLVPALITLAQDQIFHPRVIMVLAKGTRKKETVPVCIYRQAKANSFRSHQRLRNYMAFSQCVLVDSLPSALALTRDKQTQQQAKQGRNFYLDSKSLLNCSEPYSQN